MVLGWFGGRGGPGTPATVAPVPGPVWTGSTVAPVSISGSAVSSSASTFARSIRQTTVNPFLHPRAPVSTRMPSLRNARIDHLTVVSPSSVCRWIVPLEHQIPDPSSLALSAKNMMICLRAALPNFRSAHAFATRQLIGAPRKTHGRANFVQVLYEISVVFGESDGKPNGPFCKLLQNSLRISHIFQLVLAIPAGFEPATCPLGGGCSIQLSHGTTPDRHTDTARGCHLFSRFFIKSAIACWCTRDWDNIQPTALG